MGVCYFAQPLMVVNNNIFSFSFGDRVSLYITQTLASLEITV